MRAFEVFVAPSPKNSAAGRPRGARDVLDVFVHGANVTARVDDPHGLAVLCDLARAVSELAAAPRGKALVRFYEQPWELCVERLGGSASLSVYRTGPHPDVAVYDACVPFADVVGGARDAVQEALASCPLGDDGLAFDLAEAAAKLDEISLAADEPPAPDSEPVPVSVELEPDVPIAFGADFALRSAHRNAGAPTTERTDLHGLLFRGRVRAVVRGRGIELGEALPFLFAERLLSIMQRVLDAFEQGRVLHLREDAGGAGVGVRLGAGGEVALMLSPMGSRTHSTFPSLGVSDAVFAALAFGRSLVRAILRRDRGQAHNLRLVAFRRALRETQDRLRETWRTDARENPRPEAYRAYATTRLLAQKTATAHAPSARLRYTSRWRALVPGIDLRSTFLCGDRLVVGAAAETFCLDRKTGEVQWRVPTRKASSVPTPHGIARLSSDGQLGVLDLVTGESRVQTSLRPRTGGPVAGAVVAAPGLPKLIIVTEGEHHLVAVDLLTGEARWRASWGKGNVLRLRRLGKLLYCTSGDTAISAFDVQTGSVVWRVRDRLRFCGTPVFDHERLYTVAGGMGGAAVLYGIDLFAGSVRFATRVPGPDRAGDLHPAEGALAAVEGAPLVCGRSVAVVVRDRQGVRLASFDRETGELGWVSGHTVAPSGTSWLAVDDVILGNTPTGELLALDARDGSLRYRHVLGRTLEVDVPRRLEPVLRGGAVYVPHADVHVFRPADGVALGTVGPCETIPDLLRIDERCDVYVAEESGHMACFGVASRLERVK
ncbi:MAG TPA: PQQ-binding-like beta-propeller repeat protein [Polyangiaceae bacterium]|nr:PQQ-binding-like beta-propeller repeat protein [Polyangiaceae bacterium]